MPQHPVRRIIVRVASKEEFSRPPAKWIHVPDAVVTVADLFQVIVARIGEKCCPVVSAAGHSLLLDDCVLPFDEPGGIVRDGDTITLQCNKRLPGNLHAPSSAPVASAALSSSGSQPVMPTRSEEMMKALQPQPEPSVPASTSVPPPGPALPTLAGKHTPLSLAPKTPHNLPSGSSAVSPLISFQCVEGGAAGGAPSTGAGGDDAQTGKDNRCPSVSKRPQVTQPLLDDKLPTAKIIGRKRKRILSEQGRQKRNARNRKRLKRKSRRNAENLSEPPHCSGDSDVEILPGETSAMGGEKRENVLLATPVAASPPLPSAGRLPSSVGRLGMGPGFGLANSVSAILRRMNESPAPKSSKVEFGAHETRTEGVSALDPHETRGGRYRVPPRARRFLTENQLNTSIIIPPMSTGGVSAPCPAKEEVDSGSDIGTVISPYSMLATECGNRGHSALPCGIRLILLGPNMEPISSRWFIAVVRPSPTQMEVVEFHRSTLDESVCDLILNASGSHTLDVMNDSEWPMRVHCSAISTLRVYMPEGSTNVVDTECLKHSISAPSPSNGCWRRDALVASPVHDSSVSYPQTSSGQPSRRECGHQVSSVDPGLMHHADHSAAHFNATAGPKLCHVAQSLVRFIGAATTNLGEGTQ